MVPHLVGSVAVLRPQSCNLLAELADHPCVGVFIDLRIVYNLARL